MKEIESEKKILEEKREQEVRREIREYIVRRFGGQPLIQPFNGKTVMAVHGAVMDDIIKERAKKLNIKYSDKGRNTHRFEANSPDDLVKLFYHFEY